MAVPFRPSGVVCRMAHFSITNSIPISWLYILTARIRVFSSFSFFQTVWLSDWSFPKICCYYYYNYYYTLVYDIIFIMFLIHLTFLKTLFYACLNNCWDYFMYKNRQFAFPPLFFTLNLRSVNIITYDVISAMLDLR